MQPIVPLTYDGVDLNDWDAGIWFVPVVGIAEVPTVRGDDTTIPAAAGSLEGNRVNDHLAIELRGIIRAASAEATIGAQQASYYDNLRTIRTLFATNRARADLVATLPNGDVLTISARPLNIVSAETIPGEFAELSVSLEGDADWVVT